jgi:formyltetrahydrofolate dehydrogenase
VQISPDTNFFAQGAGSLDATRLVENLHSSVGLSIGPEDIYQAPVYADFVKAVLKAKGGAPEYKTVKVKANGLELSLPVQHFIGGRFVDGKEGKTWPTINPATEEAIVEVSDGGAADVDAAVNAAKARFSFQFLILERRMTEERFVMLDGREGTRWLTMSTATD